MTDIIIVSLIENSPLSDQEDIDCLHSLLVRHDPEVFCISGKLPRK